MADDNMQIEILFMNNIFLIAYKITEIFPMLCIPGEFFAA